MNLGYDKGIGIGTMREILLVFMIFRYLTTKVMLGFK